MSVQVIKDALEKSGINKMQAAAITSLLLKTIEEELASKSSFMLKGIGRLEVVANRLGNRKTPIGGLAATGIPVRVRFVVSRGLKSKIAAAYRRPE
ncbi:HU family DNA-binding protein [Polaromonas sp.]|uniref:HU family DNA-binding protein n=1 Tax=Polaromonas sp. TaxID=1869339 RepID=UPI00352A375B